MVSKKKSSIPLHISLSKMFSDKQIQNTHIKILILVAPMSISSNFIGIRCYVTGTDAGEF